MNEIKNGEGAEAVFGKEHPYAMMSHIMDMVAEHCGVKARASFCDIEGNTQINYYDMMELIDKGDFVVNIDVPKHSMGNNGGK